jgi:hypothetical protein
MKNSKTTLLRGNKKSIAFLKKLSVFSLFLLLNIGVLKAQDFIQEIPESKAKVTGKAKKQLDKLKKNENILSMKFIEIGDLKKIQFEGKVKFKLPEIKEDLELITFRMEYKSDTDYTWYATTKDGIGSVIIIRNGDDYTGHFSLGDKREYQIVNEDGQHILLRMKPSKDGEKFCDSKPTGKEKNNTKPKNISAERVESCWDPIRVLVLWTQNAENTGLNPNDVINTAVAQFNSSIYRSNITSDATMILAGSQRIDFTETTNIEGDWNTFANLLNTNNSVLQNLRNNANADIVVLLTDGNYGNTNGTVGNFNIDANSAYAVVEIGDAVGNSKVFAHEVGHLFDARHINDNTGQGYAHSHIMNMSFWNFSFTLNTMMHPFSGEGRLENFSNPNVDIWGTSTGISDVRDNARRISETWQIVRNHNPSGGTFSASIDGPISCNLYEPYTWEAVTRCGQSPASYEWYTSFDGFNWQLRSFNEFFTDAFYWGAYSYRFLWLRANSNGHISDSYATIYLYEGNQGGRLATNTLENSSAPIVWKNRNLEENEIGKTNLKIEQIYPNPSQSAFSLSFNTSIEQDISFDLIDGNGRTVNLFTEEHYQKGKYSKSLDVGNLSSGTYIVKLSSDTESATTKLIITK